VLVVGAVSNSVLLVRAVLFKRFLLKLSPILCLLELSPILCLLLELSLFKRFLLELSPILCFLLELSPILCFLLELFVFKRFLLELSPILCSLLELFPCSLSSYFKEIRVSEEKPTGTTINVHKLLSS
jgi:hypothetical protein